MTPEMIIAISGLLTGLGALISNFVVSARKNKVIATKSTIEQLQNAMADLRAEHTKETKRINEHIEQLEKENKLWRKRYDKLYQYVLDLRRILIENNITVPDMPDFDDVTDGTPSSRKRSKK